MFATCLPTIVFQCLSNRFAQPNTLSTCRNHMTPLSELIFPPSKFTSTVRFLTSGKLNDSWVHFVTGNSFSLFNLGN
jgi:hypothetical protein